MAFFSLKATCAICGKEVGLNRFRIGKTTSGKDIWKCMECTQKGGLLNINYETGKITFIDNKETETRMKCNACGHVYCYTFEDLQRNEKLAKGAVIDSLLGVGEAVGGTRLGSQVATAKADSKMNPIVDYTKCPHCHSADVKALTKEEWEIESAKQTQTASAPASSADEIKKFKELLDMGVITQEEFDAKKKHLLGL
nr:SHOCT domain-containing protein [uncultured Dysosmobacter sp.]